MELTIKTGTQSEADPFEFIMSDESEDRVGDIIEAKGWKLAHFRKNPIALWGHDSSMPPIGTWESVRVEGKRLLGRLKLAAPGTSRFVDTIRSLLEQRILRAVSVGFMPKKAEPIENSKFGGVRFTEQELYECSVVSIPANPNALSLAKSLAAGNHLSPDERKALLGKPADEKALTRSLPPMGGASPGKPAARSPASGTPSMSLAERILAASQKLLELRDTLSPLTTKMAEGEDLTEEELAQFDTLSEEIEASEKDLDRLRKTEKQLGAKAATAVASRPSTSMPAVVQPGSVRGQKQGERPLDLLVKLGVIHLLAHISRQPLDVIRSQRYGDRDDVEAVTKHMVGKAASVPATTTQVGWATELVSFAQADFLEALRPLSVFGALRPLGISLDFDGNGSIKIPRRNYAPGAQGDLRGSFVGEGRPIPVRQGSFGSINLLPHKFAVISTFTREIMQRSTPAIEGLIRQGILEDSAVAVDTALLDALPGDAIRPAGLLNGVVAIPGTAGGGIEAITGDLKAAITPFSDANAASGLVWLINPATALTLTFYSTAVGVFPFKDQVAAGSLGGIPMIQSTAIAPDELILLRASDLATVGGEPGFDVSDTATLHMDDGGYPVSQAIPAAGPPFNITGGTTSPAVPVRSLWQTDSIGLRMIMDLTWAFRRPGMLVHVTGLTW